MKAKRVLSICAAVALLGSSLVLLGTQSTQTFSATHYYILSLGSILVDVQTLAETAQSRGLTVVRYEADGPMGYRGDQPAVEPVDLLLASQQLLVIDGARFYLRDAGAAYAYTVRPAAAGYELVLNPLQDLETIPALFDAMLALQEIGLAGAEIGIDLQQISAYAKNDPKGPLPPEGAAVDSSLFGLMLAEDWFGFARSKGLTLVGLRTEVVAEILPGSGVPQAFSLYVIDQTDGLVKLLLPIEDLLALAESDGVGYVRPPYRPAVP